MEPYTVDGLAKLDGKTRMSFLRWHISGSLCFLGEVMTDPENNNDAEKDKEKKEEEALPEKVSTHYKLRGIIVHSGQASGGHYYSYILQRYEFPEVSKKFLDM